MDAKKLVISLVLFGYPIQAQTGGSYDLSHNVIASGGGSSSNGTFRVDGTIGQGNAGTTSTGGSFSLTEGFWIPALAPTAANVRVSGRVMTTAGQGIANVVITLTGQDGISVTTRSTSFGYYRFESVQVGSAYLLTVTSRRFVFIDPTRVITVNDEVTDADFIAEPQ
ncbi:MAG TPA: carboxypeptidase-like regulatory domain-containing protein [Pyrinomonadaceae bacterium]|nr:carboxypeptidase-like regulatory domain-containing protein [Pyrinomonadaceae bacterium]